jgi:hypothetical protein
MHSPVHHLIKDYLETNDGFYSIIKSGKCSSINDVVKHFNSYLAKKPISRFKIRQWLPGKLSESLSENLYGKFYDNELVSVYLSRNIKNLEETTIVDEYISIARSWKTTIKTPTDRTWDLDKFNEATEWLEDNIDSVDEGGVKLKTYGTKMTHQKFALVALTVLIGAAAFGVLWYTKQNKREEKQSGQGRGGESTKPDIPSKPHVLLDLRADDAEVLDLGALDLEHVTNLVMTHQNYKICEEDPSANLDELAEDLNGSSLLVSFPVDTALAETLMSRGILTSQYGKLATAMVDASRRGDLSTKHTSSTEAFKLGLTRRGSTP